MDFTPELFPSGDGLGVDFFNITYNESLEGERHKLLSLPEVDGNDVDAGIETVVTGEQDTVLVDVGIYALDGNEDGAPVGIDKLRVEPVSDDSIDVFEYDCGFCMGILGIVNDWVSNRKLKFDFEGVDRQELQDTSSESYSSSSINSVSSLLLSSFSFNSSLSVSGWESTELEFLRLLKLNDRFIFNLLDSLCLSRRFSWLEWC